MKGIHAYTTAIQFRPISLTMSHHEMNTGMYNYNWMNKNKREEVREKILDSLASWHERISAHAVMFWRTGILDVERQDRLFQMGA